MAIFAVGAYYDSRTPPDVSGQFVAQGVVGVGWPATDAPELHQFIRSLKVCDIVYIKSASPSSADILVKGIGLVRNDCILSAADTNGLVQIGRQVVWLVRTEFRITKPDEKNNVRLNTMYEEFHPEVQAKILERVLSNLQPSRATL